MVDRTNFVDQRQNYDFCLFTSIKKNRSDRSFPWQLDKGRHSFHPLTLLLGEMSDIPFQVAREKNDSLLFFLIKVNTGRGHN